MSELQIRTGPVLVIGSSLTDIIGRSTNAISEGTSNPGKLRMAQGGVSRNVAENLAQLGMDVILLTAVGDDIEGETLLQAAAAAGIDPGHAIRVPDGRTGAYLAVLDQQGNLLLGLDDLDVIKAITPAYIRNKRALFKHASAVFMDANLSARTMKSILMHARRAGIPVAADPTSAILAPRLAEHLQDLWLITPNVSEAQILTPHRIPRGDQHAPIMAARHLVSSGVDIAIITMSEFGLSYATTTTSGHIPALRTEIIDPTGASDALTAAVLFGLLNHIPVDEAARLGAVAASLTLRTPGSVVPDLSLELLYNHLG